MTIQSVREFLESSTIHGLSHISTSKSRVARALWVVIVVTSFATAIYMISSSYKEWQESPVSTTITTHPITELQFPTVTVCPPRGSNTALNHLLEKVKHVNFSTKEGEDMLEMSKEIFLRIPNKKHAEEMVGMLSAETMKSILNNQTNLPEVQQDGKIVVKVAELQGSLRTPKFKSLELSLPEKIGETVGEGALKVSVKAMGNWSFSRQNGKFRLYTTKLNMNDAEDFCVGLGGHLASIGSYEEHIKLLEIARHKMPNNYGVWFGGIKKPDKGDWMWLDGRTWNYTRWGSEPKNRSRDLCLRLGQKDGLWYAPYCNIRTPFFCAVNSKKKSGDTSLILRKGSLKQPTFQFWWQDDTDKNRSSSSMLVNWKIENGSVPDIQEFVSKDLEGRVSTPGLGSLSPANYYKQRHEFSAVIEFPDNISVVLLDGALVVDIDVTIPDNHPELGVDMWTTSLFYNNILMSWLEAEAFCVSKRGHLASASSPNRWQRLLTFLAVKGINGTSFIWIGGKYSEELGRQWTWVDGTKWSEEHWEPHQQVTGWRMKCLSLSKTTTWTWLPYGCFPRYPSICELPTTEKISSDTQLVFTSTNISLQGSGFQFTWQTSPDLDYTDVNLGEGSKNSSWSLGEVIGGFALSWRAVKNNRNSHKLNMNEEDVAFVHETQWMPKNISNSKKKNWLLMSTVNLVQESRKRNLKEETLWNVLLKWRWSNVIIKESPCLDELRVAQVIVQSGQELNLRYGFNTCISSDSEEELVLATKLFSVLHYCPQHLVESAKLSAFFGSLLKVHSLETVLAATMHNLQPRASDNIKDFTTMNMWFDRLSKRYNFSLGPAIIGMSTTEQLSDLAKLDPPYLKEYQKSISLCVQKGKCNNLTLLYGDNLL